MCGCNKNQTPDSVFDALFSAKIDFRKKEVVGLGFFVVPAPENGILEYRTVTVEGLSYDECVKRGSNCEAFQWLPLNVPVTIDGKSVSVGSASEFERIKPLFCNDACRGGCPMGCTCFGNDTRCRQNN